MGGCKEGKQQKAEVCVNVSESLGWIQEQEMLWVTARILKRFAKKSTFWLIKVEDDRKMLKISYRDVQYTTFILLKERN